MSRELTITYNCESNYKEMVVEVPKPGHLLPLEVSLRHATSLSLPLDEITPNLVVIDRAGFGNNRYLNDPTLGNLSLAAIEAYPEDPITILSHFFRHTVYDHPLDKWDVSRVEFMYGMFAESAFHQDLGMWDVKPRTITAGMFYKSKFTKDEVKNWDWVKNLNWSVDHLFAKV